MRWLILLTWFLASTSQAHTAIRVAVTGYCAGPCRVCGTNRITARGTLASRNRTVAADWRYYPPGTVVYIGNQKFVVSDTGGAVKGRYHLDRCFRTHREAKQWGKRKLTIRIKQRRGGGLT